MISVFLEKPRSEWVAENDLAFAIRDGFPVSPGHTLIVPKRTVESWQDASREEKIAIVDLIDEIQQALIAELRPQGFNVGFNSGVAAGQTVMHLHVHVIPRFEGDVPDPRGGIRKLFPDKAAYWETDPKA